MMMLTFQMQLQESSSRLMYTSSMIAHMDNAASRVNKAFSLAGVGIPPDSVCVYTGTDRVVFRSYWDSASDTLSQTKHTVEMKIASVENPYGKALIISQDGTPLNDLGTIFYIENMSLIYYDKNGTQTTQPALVRSADVLLTFRRDSPWNPNRPLRSNIQVKCFFMNSYLKGA